MMLRGLQLKRRMGVLKAWFWRPYWFLQSVLGGPKLTLGSNFSLQGRLILRGPGQITLGDDVVVDAVTTLFTHSPQARISIGSRSYVNGARMGCFQRIEIGDEALLGDCRIMDSDFHEVHQRRMRVKSTGVTAPVKMGHNVWLGAGSAVLKGVEIGDHSVIAFGSIVTKSVPSGRIVGGNPARDLGAVPE